VGFHAKANPELQTAENQASVLRQMDSIGNLRAYFSQVHTTGQSALRALHEANLMRDELLDEGEI
jgi:hypothetical protein